MLSVTVCWQILIVYSADATDSAKTLIMAANQSLKETYNNYKKAANPKNPRKKAIYFLQGIPGLGPPSVDVLLKKFGSIENVILATEDELLEIEGLGVKKVKKIREFLHESFIK